MVIGLGKPPRRPKRGSSRPFDGCLPVVLFACGDTWQVLNDRTLKEAETLIQLNQVSPFDRSRCKTQHGWACWRWQEKSVFLGPLAISGTKSLAHANACLRNNILEYPAGTGIILLSCVTLSCCKIQAAPFLFVYAANCVRH